MGLLRMKVVTLVGVVALLPWGAVRAQGPQLSDETRRYVAVDAPVIALRHVRVVDGSGAPPRDDQTIVISGGVVTATGDAGATAVPPDAKVLDHVLTSAADAADMVRYWAEHGATSFKAYTDITRAELGAAIAEAHRRGLKVTGHLCSVTFREAAALGIDNLEHGLVVSSDFVHDKTPDACPKSPGAVLGSIAALDIAGDSVTALIHDLIARHVAMTSTLAILETFVPHRAPIRQPALDAMTVEARTQYLQNRARIGEDTASLWTVLFRKEMQFERAYVAAGGVLLAGSDPTGYGGVVPGYSNQREIELLVEAGFTPVDAIRIATSNGAQYLGRADRVGTIAKGKAADLLIVRGDPVTRIQDIENAELVFKDGVGYDSPRLFDAARGTVGLH